MQSDPAEGEVLEERVLGRNETTNSETVPSNKRSDHTRLVWTKQRESERDREVVRKFYIWYGTL